MGHEIRKYLGLVDGDNPLSGHVEVDEAYLGGHMKLRKGRKGRILDNKVIVVGMVERGGAIMTKVEGTHVCHACRLAKYLGEFEFRWNLRKHPEAMFPLLLRRLATSP